MAVRWLSGGQSDWGGSYSATPSKKLIALLVSVVFLTGVFAGYGFRAVTAKPKSVLTQKQFRDSAIIDPHLDAMTAGAKNEDGAARAVTTFIAGYTVLAEKSMSDVEKAIDGAIVPSADPALRNSLLQTVATVRQRIYGGVAGQAAKAKLVVAPATYKTTVIDENNIEVKVWYMTVFLQAENKYVQSSWTTDTIQVRWSDHWRIATYKAEPGPSPVQYTASGQPSTFDEVATVFDYFKAFRYATAAPLK